MLEIEDLNRLNDLLVSRKDFSSDIVVNKPDYQAIWDQFHTILREKGLGEDFVKYWQNSSRQILLFYHQLVNTYKQIANYKGQEIQMGDERILVGLMDIEGVVDVTELTIKHQTTLQENEIFIAADEKGIEDIINPPKIVSKIRASTEEESNLTFTLTLRKALISGQLGINSMQRKEGFTDPDYNIPEVTSEANLRFPGLLSFARI